MTRPSGRAAIAALAVLLASPAFGACGGEDRPDTEDAGTPAADAATDAAVDATTDAAVDAGGLPPGVSFEEAPGETWACRAPEACVDDYYALSTRAAAWAQPVSEQDVLAQIEAIDAGDVAVLAGPMSNDDLSAALVDALGMGFLLDGLDDRPLRVLVTGRTPIGDAQQTELLLEDPFVGRFPALLLEPLGAGPFPALVALHGHGDDAAAYRDDFHGGEWPGRGYAILIPTLRAMNIDEWEYEVTMDLLEHGFDLIALRAYEALLCRRVLSALAEVDPSRIGFIGHSGGSSTGNLLVRITSDFTAYVSDNAVDYFRSGLELPHCETAPEVFPFHDLVNDFATAPYPVLDVPYGYSTGMGPIFAFMDEQLGGGP